MQIMKIFWILNIDFKKMSLNTVFIIIFIKSFLNWYSSSTYSKPFTGGFWDIAHPCKLVASKYWIYDDSLFLSYFFIYLLFAFAYLCIARHILPRVLFSAISNISILVNNSISTSLFLKQGCHTNPGADKNWAGSSSYISIHFFLKFSNTSASNNVSLWTYKPC